MFKWPDPPDGQIIVRLPFVIYWAVSVSITLILGSAMICLAKWESLIEALSMALDYCNYVLNVCRNILNVMKLLCRDT
jgi:hypothetical protein